MRPFFLNSSIIYACPLSNVNCPPPPSTFSTLDLRHICKTWILSTIFPLFFIFNKKTNAYTTTIYVILHSMCELVDRRYFYHVVFWPVYISAGPKKVRTSALVHCASFQQASESVYCTSALVLCAGSQQASESVYICICALYRFLAGLKICVHLHLCSVQVPSRPPK